MEVLPGSGGRPLRRRPAPQYAQLTGTTVYVPVRLGADGADALHARVNRHSERSEESRLDGTSRGFIGILHCVQNDDARVRKRIRMTVRKCAQGSFEGFFPSRRTPPA